MLDRHIESDLIANLPDTLAREAKWLGNVLQGCAASARLEHRLIPALARGNLIEHVVDALKPPCLLCGYCVPSGASLRGDHQLPRFVGRLVWTKAPSLETKFHKQLGGGRFPRPNQVPHPVGNPLADYTFTAPQSRSNVADGNARQVVGANGLNFFVGEAVVNFTDPVKTKLYRLSSEREHGAAKLIGDALKAVATLARYANALCGVSRPSTTTLIFFAHAAPRE